MYQPLYLQGFIFDIYIHKDNSEEPPYHIGFTHIVPSNMKYSNEVIVCPITSVRHKPIGELKSKAIYIVNFMNNFY